MANEIAADKDERGLLDLVPEDGSAIGNGRLRTALGWTEEKYFDTRNTLVDRDVLALGRGRGGSVYRVTALKAAAPTKAPATKIASEKSLYKPIAESLTKYLSQDLRRQNFAIQITAFQGSKATGGMWTRPDITVVSVNNYQYVPGRLLDLITYEVKPEGGWEINGVFETASHSRFATHSYLMIHTPGGYDAIDAERLERIETGCSRFEIGLVLFSDPTSHDTYDFRLEPVRRQPDPEEMNRFIEQQLNAQTKKHLMGWL